MPRRSDVGTKFAIETWGYIWGQYEWIETGFQDIETLAEAEREAADRFHPNGQQTRIVEYVTTSRVASTSPPDEVMARRG